MEEKKEIQNRLEEFIDKVWGTSCFAETPFNNYTEEKRERDYDKAMEDMIGFIQQELDRAREEGYKDGVSNLLKEFEEVKLYKNNGELVDRTQEIATLSVASEILLSKLTTK